MPFRGPPPVGGKKAGILVSGLVDREMVAGAYNAPKALVLPFEV